MLRVIANIPLRRLIRTRLGLNADGTDDPPVIARILKHAEVQFTYRTPAEVDAQGNVTKPAGPPVVTYDVLLDRDAADLPNAAVTFLRNRAEVIYVAELVNGVPTVLKGSDPGYHSFFGVSI